MFIESHIFIKITCQKIQIQGRVFRKYFMTFKQGLALHRISILSIIVTSVIPSLCFIIPSGVLFHEVTNHAAFYLPELQQIMISANIYSIITIKSGRFCQWNAITSSRLYFHILMMWNWKNKNNLSVTNSSYVIFEMISWKTKNRPTNLRWRYFEVIVKSFLLEMVREVFDSTRL